MSAHVSRRARVKVHVVAQVLRATCPLKEKETQLDYSVDDDSPLVELNQNSSRFLGV